MKDPTGSVPLHHMNLSLQPWQAKDRDVRVIFCAPNRGLKCVQESSECRSEIADVQPGRPGAFLAAFRA
eukprot:925206-Pyramimonas_sp.AAC.1